MSMQATERLPSRLSPLLVIRAALGWAMIMAAGAFATLVIFLILMQPDEPGLWGALGLAAFVALLGCLMAFYRRRRPAP